MKPEHPEVPLVELREQYAEICRSVDDAIMRVMRTQRFVLGPEVAAFEDALAAYCGAAHGVGCASGSDALLLALAGLGVGPGDQVLCPAYTSLATAGSIARLGAEPVFADVDPATYNVCIESLEERAERCTRLKAIVPVHLFGQAAQLPQIEALARRRGAALVEDAAQAVGALDQRGRRVGGSEHPACFSFSPMKNLGGVGDGGLVTTQDAHLAEVLRGLRSQDDPGPEAPRRIGMNSRLDALQAAVLRAKLPHIEAWNEARRRHAEHYDELLGAAGAQQAWTPLDERNLPLRTPARCPAPARHVFNRYVIRVPRALRDDLHEHLAERRIQSSICVPRPLHLHPCFAHREQREGELPAAEAAARETLALPIYPELSEAQREHVAANVVGFLERRSLRRCVSRPRRRQPPTRAAAAALDPPLS